MCKIELDKEVIIIEVIFREPRIIVDCLYCTEEREISVDQTIVGFCDAGIVNLYTTGDIMRIYSVDSDEFLNNVSRYRKYRKIFWSEYHDAWLINLDWHYLESDFLLKENRNDDEKKEAEIDNIVECIEEELPFV